ncbi:MAG: RNA methyltransferase [Taibaiella sp.]|nr:RNA methyltransferase [Taibaiella sp.]
MKALPDVLTEKLKGVKGYDEQAFLNAHQLPAVTSVRLHPAKQSNAFINNDPVPWCPEGRYLDERPVFTTDPLYHAGAYYVQEASSMFLDHLLKHLLPDNKNLRVLDLCAAPGGKSTLLASFLDKSSLLVSNEVIRTRASILEENMLRWGYMNTWVTSNDPKDLGKLHGYFDVIVVDAPCSGSGLFRKDAKALADWSEANVQLCSQRQHRILADVWPALKENGILVYATCSYSPEEDEQVLQWLNEHYDVEPLTVPLKEAWGITEIRNGAACAYRFFPDKVKGEGFFIAAVRKKAAADTLKPQRFKTGNDKKIQQQAAYLLQPSDDIAYLHIKDEYCAVIAEHEKDIALLQQYVYLRKTGLVLGTPAAKEWLPAHDVALSVNRGNGIPFVQVNKEQALRYLKKEDLQLPDTAKGWHIIQYEGLGLGWIKALSGRVNNYLPKHWRIRMEITDADWQ